MSNWRGKVNILQGGNLYFYDGLNRPPTVVFLVSRRCHDESLRDDVGSFVLSYVCHNAGVGCFEGLDNYLKQR